VTRNDFLLSAAASAVGNIIAAVALLYVIEKWHLFPLEDLFESETKVVVYHGD
jgi:hypothetical protein